MTYSGGFYYRTGNPNNPGYPPAPGSINASWTPVADKGDPGDGTSLTAGTGISIDDSVISLDMPDALSGFSDPINEVGTKATGTITFTGSPSPGETITIASTTYYLAPTTSPGTPTDVSAPIGLSLLPVTTRWALALVSRINSWIGGGSDPNVIAYSSYGVVTLTAKAAGPTGNGITLSELAGNVSITSAMSGGSIVSYASPVATHLGQLYYATSSKIWYRWDGNEWVKDDEYVEALSGLSTPLSPTKYAQGYPNMVLVGQDIIVSGITSPLAANGLYSPTGATGSLGKPTYQKAGSPSFTIASGYYEEQSPSPSVWALVESAGSIGLGSVGINTTLFLSGSNTTNTTPVDAAFWTRQNTSKDVTVASPVGSYLGQLYNKLFSGLWYRWNGTGWDADKVLTAGTGINITDSVISATGGATNLAATLSATNIIVTSDTGTDATLPAADGTNAGLLVPAQFTMLSNLSGTNTGDQTNITGNAATVTGLTLGGNLTTSGAFPLTLITTAATSVTLPASGTLAKKDAETHTGSHSFGLRPLCSATAASLTTVNGTSLITRNDADTRYGASSQIIFSSIIEGSQDFTANTLTTVVSLFLPKGVYQIDAFMASVHQGGGCQMRFGISPSTPTQTVVKVCLTDSFGKQSASPSMIALISDNYPTNPAADVTRSDATTGAYRRAISGLLEVTATAGSTLTLDYACLTPVGAGLTPSKLQTRPYIIARKIS